MLKLIIGIIIGVWLGAVNPTVATAIQDGTRSAYEWVVNDGADALITAGETLKEAKEQPMEPPKDPSDN